MPKFLHIIKDFGPTSRVRAGNGYSRTKMSNQTTDQPTN